MRDLLIVLADVARSSKEEDATLLTLSAPARKDSRFTKILTFVAMLCLPGSLDTVIHPINFYQELKLIIGSVDCF